MESGVGLPRQGHVRGLKWPSESTYAFSISLIVVTKYLTRCKLMRVASARGLRKDVIHCGDRSSGSHSRCVRSQEVENGQEVGLDCKTSGLLHAEHFSVRRHLLKVLHASDEVFKHGGLRVLLTSKPRWYKWKADENSA